ncbi:hypothetical protein GJAV_G00145920 [Gymnothorax javanicus]|nr:hypothetical protein GJAV_G00145920 [Gymnothorax javanicus]
MAGSPEATSESLPICRKHKAPLGLYCVEMEELACEGCKEASGCKKYRFWTVQVAAQEHKVVLTISRDKLLAKVKGREKAQKIFSDMAKHLKTQARETERDIKDEFEKLHRFLREEEEARITALKEEEEQKSQAIKERIQMISKELSSTLDTIKTIEQELAAEDIAFLQNYKITIDKTWRCLQDEPSQTGARNLMAKLAELMKLPGQVHDDTVKRMCTPHRDVEVITGGLIDVAKYLGNLKHRVWERMLQTVQYTPVTLDPNTAAPCLSLSEGLTAVSYCGDPPQLPDNPERLIYGVLGSQGFSSGRHHWDVVVGDNTKWAVGVATQSVSRKDRTARPGCGEDLGVSNEEEEGSHRCRRCGGPVLGALPVCWACRTSSSRRTDSRASQLCDEELKMAIKPLKKWLDSANEVKQICSQAAKHKMIQALQTERKIRDEFEKLHQFLREEEAARIAAVREEEKLKSQMMQEKKENMKRELSSLSDTVKAMERQLKADNVSFLQEYKTTMARVWAAPKAPEEVLGALIDVPKHLSNLRYRVWQKMLETVQYNPVILDPNSADSFLQLSEDLTSVWESNTDQRLPDTPERFTSCAEMLGSQGYGSGRHRWDVEVGENSSWIIGVAGKSAQRKAVISACPENRIWAVCLRDDEYWALESPSVPILVQDRPQSVRLELDWDGGELTFSDPSGADSTPLYTFKYRFTEMVYPYFCTSSQEHPLRIVPEQVLSQARQTERQIKDEFEKLHRFLREEEEARIAALREEEEQRSQMMKEKTEKMKEQISSLSDTITAVKNQLEAEDVSFLWAYKATMKRVWSAPEGPEKVPGALIDVSKHLSNLKYRVWEKMLETVQYTPITLDPNTAAPSIALSDDLTQGDYGGQQEVPENPERFQPYTSILGSRGYNSGRHSWQVEVGDSTNWTLGVAAESIRRKEQFSACPDEGLWAVSLRDGMYWAMDTPCAFLPVQGKLQRVQVELDWDAGEVTFSDPTKTDGIPLYTFSHTFTQLVYPYFESLCKDQPLRILPEKICVLGQESTVQALTV